VGHGIASDEIPEPGCSYEQIIEFAATYDGYERIAASPERLGEVCEPIRKEWRQAGVLPDWPGIDLLRGLLFLMYREDRHGGPMGYLDEAEEVEYLRPFRQVIEAIRDRCN